MQWDSTMHLEIIVETIFMRTHEIFALSELEMQFPPNTSCTERIAEIVRRKFSRCIFLLNTLLNYYGHYSKWNMCGLFKFHFSYYAAAHCIQVYCTHNDSKGTFINSQQYFKFKEIWMNFSKMFKRNHWHRDVRHTLNLPSIWTTCEISIGSRVAIWQT